MKDGNELIVFENKKIRRVWYKDDWWFSVVDVVGVLSESIDVKQYLKKMRQRDLELKSKWGTLCTPVEIIARDGRKRLINCANKEGLFRIIQSIPSKKAEPFKLWLAKVGSERIDEIENPELAIDRAMRNYLALGYSEKWINQRIKTIEVRKELTDEWKRSGVEEGDEFAILTNEMIKTWSGKSIKAYRELKGLRKENLRDNMTNLELALNMLAEVTTTEFSKEENPDGLNESLDIARKGSGIVGDTRKDIEKNLDKKVISSKNSKDIIDSGEKERLR